MESIKPIIAHQSSTSRLEVMSKKKMILMILVGLLNLSMGSKILAELEAKVDNFVNILKVCRGIWRKENMVLLLLETAWMMERNWYQEKVFLI